MTLTGVVTRNDGPRFWVSIGQDEIPCLLRGRLKKEQLRVTSLVVVGDAVTIDQLPDGTGVIESVAPRRSELSRPGFHGYTHVIAANVDRLVIVQAAQQPRFKLHLVERFLAVARRGNMEPVVVVNKCDLESESTVRSWVAPLTAMGLPVILTSAERGIGLDELRSLLQGRISVLAGQSGVGKSSLLNAIYPEAGAKTSAVAINTKGRHTTTSSRLYALPDGGYLVDTPGIKSLELSDEDTTEEAVADLFPEITALADGCKFRNCTHSHEPRCAVKAAVNTGGLDRQRYQNFLRLSQ